MNNRLYDNIFGYWRGRNEDNQVLENNVTKALMNVLKLCDNTTKRAFVTRLGDQIKVDLRPRARINCVLFPRRSDLDLSTSQVKVMLGIKPYWAGEPRRGNWRHPGEPRYDGALVGPGWAVAIESKVNGELNADQIRDGRRHLGPGAVSREITWRQIHTLFSELRIKQEPRSEFLRNQFCEYLKMIHQVGFQGFREEHFGCITSDGNWLKEKDDIRDELRGVMNTLAGDLYESGFADGGMLKEIYPESNPVKGLRKGKKEYDWAYVTFFPKRTRNPKWAHQCVLIDLGDQMLHVKAEVTTQDGLRKLRRRLRSDEGKKELTTILQGVQGRCAPIWFSPYRGDTEYGFELKPTTTVDELEGHLDGLWHELANHKGRKYLKIELRKEFIKEQIIGTGSDLVTEIAGTMKSLHPFVQFVNRSSA